MKFEFLIYVIYRRDSHFSASYFGHVCEKYLIIPKAILYKQAFITNLFTENIQYNYGDQIDHSV